MQLLVPAVEYDTSDGVLADHQQMIIYEIMRQITSEEKAILILSRYGISKLLQAIKLHEEQAEIKKLVQELVLKLVRVGRR